MSDETKTTNWPHTRAGWQRLRSALRGWPRGTVTRGEVVTYLVVGMALDFLSRLAKVLWHVW